MYNIFQETTLLGDMDNSSQPDKSATDQEKSMLEKYTPILQAFLHADSQSQLHAVYALQAYAYAKDYPKGNIRILAEIS